VLGCSGDDGTGIGFSGGSGGAAAGTGTSGIGGGAGGESGAGAGGDTNVGTSGGGGGGAGGDGGAGAGSGSEPSGPDACGNTNHASGTRVQMRMAVTAEGDAFYEGMHDTLLDVDCRYQELDLEGNARCLPSHWTYFKDYDRVFTDASCTDALYGAVIDCPPELMLVQDPLSDECVSPTWRLFERGEEHATSGTFYQMISGQCAVVPIPITSALYRTGAEVDLTQYAAGTRGRWSEGGGVAVEGVIGADGSHEAQGFVDTAQDEHCDVMKLEDGDEHCVAAQHGYNEFGDAACATPAITTYQPCGPVVPKYAVMESPTVCGTNALYRVLGAYEGPVYSDSNDMCYETDPAMHVGSMLHSTELADPDAVPQLDHDVDDTDPGRLRIIRQRNADGACLFLGLHDTQLDVRCRFETAADGELRCVPVADEPGETFSDTACTLAARYVPADPCGTPPSRYAVQSEPDGCGYKLHVHHLDPTPIAMADLPTLYRKDIEGTCVVAAFGPVMHYRVGEEMPPTELVSATIELR
jgi:hypothetical protein